MYTTVPVEITTTSKDTVNITPDQICLSNNPNIYIPPVIV